MEDTLEREISFLQPKGTRAKAEIIAMRRSRAQLIRFLTPEMLDAEVEIERAFRYTAGHMGYGNSDPNRVRGQGEPSDIALDRQRRLLDAFFQWQGTCPSQNRGIVLDMLVFGFTIKDVKTQRGCTRKTVVRKYRNGLNEYCKIRGWVNE